MSNVITGGCGNEMIEGGADEDNAAYQRLKSQYDVTRLTDGSITVRDKVRGRDGTDRLTNIEYLSFKDDVQALPSPVSVTPDFNADSHTDILLQNANDGACYVWQMNGLSLLDNKSFGYVGWTPGADWHAVA